MSVVLPLVAAGVGSSFVAGVTGSLHCGLMCGPLACAATGGQGGRLTTVAWHAGRIGAYGLVGGLLGALGGSVAGALSVPVQGVLPWVMAAGLVVTALDLGKHLRPIPGVGRASRALARLGLRLGPTGRALALGAATPFLPCGLLYGLFLAALATASAAGGALVLVAFALGAVPALVAAQLGHHAVSRRWPRAEPLIRRVVPLTAAAILIVRAAQASNAACP